MTIGIAGRFPGCAYIAGTTRYDDVYLQAYQLGSEHRKAIHFSLIRSPLNDNVFPLYIPQLAETLAERLVSSGLRGKGGTSQEAYPGDLRRLLRLGRKAKSQEHTAKRKDRDFFLHVPFLGLYPPSLNDLIRPS